MGQKGSTGPGGGEQGPRGAEKQIVTGQAPPKAHKINLRARR